MVIPYALFFFRKLSKLSYSSAETLNHILSLIQILNWPPVSFWVHSKHSVSYHITIRQWWTAPLWQTVLSLAEVWSTAVRKPVGNVKADSQKIMGGWADVAHFSNCSTRSTRSRVHDASGFIDGYAYRRTHVPHIHFSRSVSAKFHYRDMDWTGPDPTRQSPWTCRRPGSPIKSGRACLAEFRHTHTPI